MDGWMMMVVVVVVVAGMLQSVATSSRRCAERNERHVSVFLRLS